VRKFFSSPDRVVESNFLRREIAGRMLERLALIKITPTRVLDAGCGEGADLPVLQERFSEAHLVGVDGASQMLSRALGKQAGAISSISRLLTKWLPGNAGAGLGSGSDFVCCDFMQLPLGGKTIDLVWSNLALHWHPQPDRVFAEWQRVLEVDGLVMFSCFGPDTFKELRTAFATVDESPHALPFVDMHDYGDMLINAGLSAPVMDMENIAVTYASADKLLADARAWGGNPLVTRRRGLLGKKALRRVVLALEQQRNAEGRIPLSFEIIYGHAFRPTPTLTAAGERIIRMDLHPSNEPSARNKKRL
jgi:malonyl-CoA O-methyltransferase